jgi:hypothetical protein
MNRNQLLNSLNKIIVVVAAGAGVALLASGQEKQANLNRAVTYYQAFLLAPEISESEQDYLASNNLWSVTLPAHFGELVSRYDSEFKLLRLALQSNGGCDWGIDMSQGPATLLPHLARCKGAMIGARYRVAWDLQNGHPEEARTDLLAAFTLARDISRDGTLISVLVQIASESIACSIVAENYGKWDPQNFQALVLGLEGAPARGTVAASIAFEKVTYHDWLLNKLLGLQKAHPGDEATVMAGFRDMLRGLEPRETGDLNAPEPSLWDKISAAGGNTSEGIVKLLQQEDLVYDKLAKVLSVSYAEFDEQAKAFKAELNPNTSPLVAEVFAACLKSRQREFKIQVYLAMVRAALEYKLHGDSGALSVKDPCGDGPFTFQRFFFEGVDRGLRLESSFRGSGFPEVMIFVDKPGPPFLLEGPHVGEARVLPKAAR